MEEQKQHTEQTEQKYVRRPLKRVSRKKWAEAIRCLKGAMACDKLSWRSRLRAVELLCLIQGLEPTVPSPHDRRQVKALVSESSFEREVRQRVYTGTLSQVQREAKAEAERVLAAQAVEQAKAEQEDLERLKAAFSFMKGTGGNAEMTQPLSA